MLKKGLTTMNDQLKVLHVLKLKALLGFNGQVIISFKKWITALRYIYSYLEPYNL